MKRGSSSDSTRTMPAVAGAAERLQLGDDDRLVARAVLEVEHQPVEPGDGHDLGGQRRAQVDERPEHRLAVVQPLPEGRRNRSAHRLLLVTTVVNNI